MKRIKVAGLGLCALSIAACSDGPNGSGGGTVQPGASFSGLYVAGASDTITRVDLGERRADEVRVGSVPARIARAGRRVYVTLRGERAVAVFEESGSGLTRVAQISTGAEPYGVAATEDRVYVAASVGGFVAEYDAKSFERLRSWSIAGEPRWLTMHSSKRALYVGSTYGGTLTHIDLSTGVARPVALPSITSFNFTDGTPVILAPRITADPVEAPNGEDLYVGMLYVDNQSTIPDVEDGVDPCTGLPTEPGMGSGSSGGAAPPPDGFGRPGTGNCGGGYNGQKFNPVVEKVPVVAATGEPDANRVPEAIQVIGGATIEDAAGNPINFESIAGYPSAIAVSDDSEYVIAAIEGAEALIALKMDFGTNGLSAGGAARAPSMDVAFPGGGAGLSFRNNISIKTGAAPAGLAIIGGRIYVHARFDQKIEEIALDDVKDVFDLQTGNITKLAEVDLNPQGGARQLRTGSPLIISSEQIDPQVDEGRRLFFATNNPLMATVGAAVSCATCHFDNRTDGLTWTFERGLRQTPNLSVNLQHTLPVGWAGNVASVALEGFNTSQKLMGGQELTESHTKSIEKFLFSIREIDTPNKANAADPKVVRGQAVYANVGCLSCHNGASYTDNKVYPMLGLEAVKTRPLTGVAASAPYFHDGSALDLHEVVRRAAAGEMGQPFSISAEDEEALVEYLKAL